MSFEAIVDDGRGKTDADDGHQTITIVYPESMAQVS